MSSSKNAIIEEFLSESFENLSNISDELTQYEKNPEDKELLNSIYRKAHTLKGSASFLGFKNLENLTHSVENLLDLARSGEVSITADVVDVILEGFDRCNDFLRNVESSGDEGSVDTAEILTKLLNVIEKKSAPEKVAIDDTPIMAKQPSLEEGSSESSTNDEKPVVVEKVKEAPQVDPVQAPAQESTSLAKQPEVKESTGMSSGGITTSTVRVNVNLLDKIMNVVGELVINRNQILQYSKQNENAELNRFAQQLNVITTELQTDIMTTRMQPVGSVFSKFERIVRDVSRQQGKKVRLDIQGKDTELDKTLLEMVKDPLVHLIRNSVDHGIETPDTRAKSGKNEEGYLAIKAYHEGGQVVIEINDDGAGINTKKVLAKAISKGLATEEEAANISHQKILNFIFNAGFSTAEKVTNISGRGVGMDVVRSNIEKIGGSISIESEEGKGTSFKLKIPLTLAIVPAIVMNTANETFAIPQKNLVELVMLEDDEVNQIEEIHGCEFFRLRGELIPIFHLRKQLNFEEDENKSSLNIIVLNAEGHQYGMIVDEVLDMQEIVVKPLSRKLKDQSVYAGATILGDGRVALIIDALGFFNMVERTEVNDSSENSIQDNRDIRNSDNQEFLLFTTDVDGKFAVPLCLVNRLEEFKPEQIEKSGNRYLVRYGDMPMPIIGVEPFLSAGKGMDLDDAKVERLDNIPCLVINYGGFSYGILVKKILDIAVTQEEVETENTVEECLMGIVYIDDKLVTILDVHKIISKYSGKTTQELESSVVKTRSAKILLVEDSPLYRKVQIDLLEELGHEVIVANNGKEGLTALTKHNDVDVIVTDIEMPEMDGWTFTSEVRKQEGNVSKLPIIAVSTRVSDADKKKGKEVGFDLHLEKLNKVEVMDAINSFLEKVG